MCIGVTDLVCRHGLSIFIRINGLKWIGHANNMDADKIPKITFNNEPRAYAGIVRAEEM